MKAIAFLYPLYMKTHIFYEEYYTWGKVFFKHSEEIDFFFINARYNFRDSLF